VFDENIFPFAKLHPNAGHRLKQDILLLPHHTSNSGGANIDDYMPLPVLPIVTTNDEDIADNSVDADTSSFQQETARNPAQNAPEMVQNTTAENARRTDPEEDPCQAAP
jgi:hypothetical protein